jgi:hypothetical protein
MASRNRLSGQAKAETLMPTLNLEEPYFFSSLSEAELMQ